MTLINTKPPIRACVAQAFACSVILATLGSSLARATEKVSPQGTLAFAVTDWAWAVYDTKDRKAECPAGVNVGSRVQIKALYEGIKGGSKADYMQMQLKREAANVFPMTLEQPLPWREVQGPTGYGLNLDGKVGPHDFVTPTGEHGIDNQLYRVIGCTLGFREVDNGTLQRLARTNTRKWDFNRLLLEVTGIDDMVHDEAVEVTVYRGLNRLVMDGNDEPLPGTTQRIDYQRGAKFIQHLKGRIVDGVLVTEPKDFIFPWITLSGWQSGTIELIRGGRFHLKLTSQKAEGLLGGYADIDTWHSNLIRNLYTGRQNLDGLDAPAMYRSLVRNADGYPDPETGAFTAISAALNVSLVQVHLLHAPELQANNLAPSVSK